MEPLPNKFKYRDAGKPTDKKAARKAGRDSGELDQGALQRTLRQYEMDDIRSMYDAGIDDIDALMYGRASFTPDELADAAAVSVMAFGGELLPDSYKGSIDSDLIGFFNGERGQNLASDVLTRHQSSNRWFFPDDINPAEARDRRNEFQQQMFQNPDMQREKPGFLSGIADAMNPKHLQAVKYAGHLLHDVKKRGKTKAPEKKLSISEQRKADSIQQAKDKEMDRRMNEAHENNPYTKNLGW